MEKYLIDQYDVIEDKKWLTDESDIEEYFEDDAREYMECGLGYFTDEAKVICKIGDKFYEVYMAGEVWSSRQDRGDRLYWIENITEVSYKEIEKPMPKPVTNVSYNVTVTAAQMAKIDGYLETNNISFEKEER